MSKIEEDILEKYEHLESTDGDLALAIKEIREQERKKEKEKLEKYAKNVPKLDMQKVQEINRLKWEADETDSYYEGEEEESESSRYENEHNGRGSYNIKQYHSERNEYEDSVSHSENSSNAKKNIRALLENSSLKLKIKQKSTKKIQKWQENFEVEAKNVEFEEKKNLFDYSEIQENSIIRLEQENTIDQWDFEPNPYWESEEDSVLGSDKYMLYGDSSSSACSYYSDIMEEEPQKKLWIPKLNLGGPPAQPKTNPNPVPPPIKKPSALGANLEGLKKKDFQDEFMENYDDFSASWREQIDREKRF